MSGPAREGAKSPPSTQPRQERGASRSSLAWTFVLALFIRLLYLAQMRGTPLGAALLGDEVLYEGWARRLAAGETGVEGAYYQAPLYAWFLALLFQLGAGFEAVKVVQAILSSAACALLHASGARWLGSSVGRVTGVLAAVQAPLMFHDLLLQKTVLVSLLTATVLWGLVSWLDLGGEDGEGEGQAGGRRAMLHAAGVGLALGLLAATRESAVVLLPVVLVLAWRRPAAGGTRAVLVASGALALALLPWVVRNSVVAGELTGVTTNLGPNLFIGNNAAADGLYHSLVPGRGYAGPEQEDARRIALASLAGEDGARTLTARGVSRFWAARAFDWMRTEPVAALALTGRKAALLAVDREWMDSRAIAAHAHTSSVLRLLQPLSGMGIILPLALLGFTWSRRRRELRLLLVLALIAFAAQLPFFVFGRYRAGILPFLLPAAAVAALELVSVREWRRRAVGVAIAVVLIVLAHVGTLARESPLAQTSDNLGVARWSSGDASGARSSWRAAIAQDPDLASAHFNLGRALAESGDLGGAAEELAEAVRLQPAFLADAHLIAASMQQRAGEFAQALTILAEARRVAPLRAEVELERARCLRALQRMAEAEDALERALVLRPEWPDALNNMGLCLVDQGRVGEALAAWERATRADPGDRRVLYNLAWHLATSGDESVADGPRAVGLAQEVLRLGERAGDGSRAARLDLLAIALARAGLFAQAEQRAQEALDACRPEEAALRAEIDNRRREFMAGRPFVPGSR